MGGKRSRPENYLSQHAKGGAAASLGVPATRCILGFLVSVVFFSGQLCTNKLLRLLIRNNRRYFKAR